MLLWYPRLGLQMVKTGSSVNEKKKDKETDEGCTHCGNPKHTWDTCFKLYGYLEWWEDLKKNRTDPRTNPGRAAIATTGTGSPGMSIIMTESPKKSGNKDYGFLHSKQNSSDDCIIDSGATEHMTFDKKDFMEFNQPK